MSRKVSVAVLACLMGLSSNVLADDSGGFGFVLGADLEFGGDDVATVSFEDGDEQDVKAGQGVTVAAGVHYSPGESGGFMSRGTIGYKFVTTAAENADIGMDRMVYELVGGYQFANCVWLAGGPVHHSGVKFDGDGFGQDIEFSDATGFTFELGWKWISLAYTNMDYEVEKYGSFSVPGSPKVDASHFGLALSYRF